MPPIFSYYNDLDKKLGSELGGCDVIDDIRSEAQEVNDVGNGRVSQRKREGWLGQSARRALDQTQLA